MNRISVFALISLTCAIVIFACLWHITSRMQIPHEGKLQSVLKALSYATDEVKRIQSLSRTLFYAEDEEKTSSLNKALLHAEDEKKIMPSLPTTLPYTVHLKKIEDIQKASWITHLYQFLQSLNKSISPQVNMVFGDSDHMDLVLNWIIAAHVRLDPPLHNIMVLSVDQQLCDFLAPKQLPVTCIAVPPTSFLKSGKHKSWGEGVKCRLFVLRIINYWGYDVASYDSDAVILRNPQPLYDSNPDVKLFAGSGTHPGSISEKWGFSLCTCVLLLKSHPSTDNLWMYIHNTERGGVGQSIFNHALSALGIRWKNKSAVKNMCSIQSGWQSDGPLNCFVFSQKEVCRGCCEKARKHHYYILHPVTKKITEKKSSRLKKMDGWFLSDSWRLNKSAGEVWLRSISNYTDS